MIKLVFFGFVFCFLHISSIIKTAPLPVDESLQIDPPNSMGFPVTIAGV